MLQDLFNVFSTNNSTGSETPTQSSSNVAVTETTPDVSSSTEDKTSEARNETQEAASFLR